MVLSRVHALSVGRSVGPSVRQSVCPSVRRSVVDCEEDATYGDRPCFFYDVEHIDVS